MHRRITFGLGLAGPVALVALLSACGGDTGGTVVDKDTAQPDTTVIVDTAQPDTAPDTTEDTAVPDTAEDTAVPDTTEDTGLPDTTEDTTEDTADVAPCTGASGCDCDDDSPCDGDLVCHDGKCAACEAGWTDCSCTDPDDTCEEDALCADGVCVPCEAGTATCLCRPIGSAGGVCDGSLACLSGHCVDGDCTLGGAQCPCKADGTCSGTGTCTGGICQPCAPGTLGCTCAASQCGPGLVCSPASACILATSTCDTSVAGSVGQTCAAAHKVCTTHPTLGTGECGACASGYVAENGACRAVKTCAEVTCTGTGKACIPATTTADATCGCATDYLPDGSGGCRARVTCASLSCGAQGRACTDSAAADSTCGGCLASHVEISGACYPTCQTLGCATAGKTCSTSGVPACGGCLAGWASNGAGGCVDLVTCSEISCTEGVCIEANGASGTNARCDTSGSCGATQVQQPNGACVNCDSCDGFDDPVGATGEHYPSPAGDGTCVCKAKDEWFVADLSGHPVVACDADGDGWVRRSAYDAARSPFPEVQAEANCTVRKIDRFVLMPDEPGGKPVVVKVEDLATDLGVETDGLTKYLELYEPDVLDDDSRVQLAHQAGSTVENHLRLRPYGLYGVNTRRFVAAELNPITKFCNHQDDDYNWNFVSDANEWYRSAPVPPPGGNLNWMVPWIRMSYFGELDRGYYVPAGSTSIPASCNRWVNDAWQSIACVAVTGSPNGAWVIQEKKRAADAPSALKLELAAAVSEPLSTAATYGVQADARDKDYWRMCRRNRPATFDGTLPPDTSPTIPTIGARNYDFGRFSCPDRVKGACYSTDPLMRPSNVSVPYDGRLPVGPRVTAPSDRVKFAGMNHGSQFRCMRPVPQQAQVSDASNQIASTAIKTPENVSARFQLFECTLSTDAASRDKAPDGSLVNPLDPGISCRIDNVPVAPESTGFFQWVFTRHATYSRDLEGTPTYQLGCIDESVEWPFMCQGFHRDPFINRATPTADGNNFGHIQCGCGQSGGATCDVGCPTADSAHAQTSPPYDPTSRAGYWMCGEVATMTPVYDPATYANMPPASLPRGLMSVQAPSPYGTGTQGTWSLRVETRPTQPVLSGSTRSCATITTDAGTTGQVCVGP